MRYEIRGYDAKGNVIYEGVHAESEDGVVWMNLPMCHAVSAKALDPPTHLGPPIHLSAESRP